MHGKSRASRLRRPGLQVMRVPMARTLRAAPSVLRISIRFLSVAYAPAIKRLQRAVVSASKLARPPAADPQRRYVANKK